MNHGRRRIEVAQGFPAPEQKDQSILLILSNEPLGILKIPLNRAIRETRAKEKSLNEMNKGPLSHIKILGNKIN